MKFFTLSQVADSLKVMIAKNYPNHYWVKLEIAKLNLYAKSGHCYPELVEKENGIIKAQFRGTIWNENYYHIQHKLKSFSNQELSDGIILLAKVTLSFSSTYGVGINIIDIDENYQLGELAKEKNATIKKLKEQDLFDANKKVFFPFLPQRLAVISIETSKGYSDFNTIIHAHPYRIEQTLFQAILQGDKAVESIVQRLDKIASDKEKYDAVLIIRGGGDDVGMTCYDHYTLAKSVASFPIPVLTGIGHSTNETVSEMVAYANKITPTELAYYIISFYQKQEEVIRATENSIYSKSIQFIHEQQIALNDLIKELKLISVEKITSAKEDIQLIQSDLKMTAKTRIEEEKSKLQLNENTIVVSVKNKIQKSAVAIDFLFEKILSNSKQYILNQKNELKLAEQKVEYVNPKKILERGFVLAQKNGKIIKSSKELHLNDEVDMVFKDGNRKTKVIK